METHHRVRGIHEEYKTCCVWLPRQWNQLKAVSESQKDLIESCVLSLQETRRMLKVLGFVTIQPDPYRKALETPA